MESRRQRKWSVSTAPGLSKRPSSNKGRTAVGREQIHGALPLNLKCVSRIKCTFLIRNFKKAKTEERTELKPIKRTSVLLAPDTAQLAGSNCALRPRRRQRIRGTVMSDAVQPHQTRHTAGLKLLNYRTSEQGSHAISQCGL